MLVLIHSAAETQASAERRGHRHVVRNIYAVDGGEYLSCCGKHGVWRLSVSVVCV